MGIGNTTTSSAVAAVLLGQPVERMTGRGAGLSDAGLARKLDAIRRGIARNQPDATDPLDVLSKLGGFDIAGLCGVFLGGALEGLLGFQYKSGYTGFYNTTETDFTYLDYAE